MKKMFKKLVPNFIKRSLKRVYLYILFIVDFRKFQMTSKKEGRFNVTWEDRYPQLFDKTTETSFDAHYIYHPAWAARILARNKPPYHTDISSKLDFSTLVSAFIPVKFYDYRPAHITLSNLTSEHADLMHLPFADASVPSLSCMHVIEHIGLGRYGDTIDPEGDLKAMSELKRVLAQGGTLLFAVPIGSPRIHFNAHRVYAYEQIRDYFKDFMLEEFALIPDNAMQVGMITNATKEHADAQNYGCGCFWFIKNEQ